MKYDYHLSDNGGISTAYDQEILIPIGTKFYHEFGLYRVDGYGDKDGNSTRVTSKIEMVFCERLKSSHELDSERKLKK